MSWVCLGWGRGLTEVAEGGQDRDWCHRPQRRCPTWANPARASPSPTPWAQSWISTAAQTPSPGNFLSSSKHRNAGFSPSGPSASPPWRPKQQPARAQGLCRHNGQLSKTPGEGNQGRLPSFGGRKPLPLVLSPLTNMEVGTALGVSEDNTLLLFPPSMPPRSALPILGGLGLRNILGLSPEPHPLLPAHPFGGVK